MAAESAHAQAWDLARAQHRAIRGDQLRSLASRGRRFAIASSEITAGLTPVRFTHARIRYEPLYVIDVLSRVRG